MAVERLNTETFEEVISALNTAVTEFASVRSSLETQTDSLISSWSGDACDSFEDAFDTLKLYMSTQYDSLDAMADDLQSIKESYEGWDSDISTEITGTTEG